MSQAQAYCEQFERNITLDEAHALYFAQARHPRKRFTFRCGDPRCRAMLQPIVVAALYDREDVPGEKFTSPYFREHAAHPHIAGCTWVGEAAPASERTSAATVRQAGDSVLDELGMVFRLKPRASGGADPGAPGQDREPADQREEDDDDAPADEAQQRARKARATSSRFMARVALRYLSYSDEQRKRIELEIEGIQKAPFYNVCMPIFSFHPHFQGKQIYQGRVRIVELSNVFLVRFNANFSPSGKRDQRNSIAEVKVLKKWLEQHDRALAALLHELAVAKETAWCFFYSDQPPLVKENKATFSVDNPAHLAVIAESALEVVQGDDRARDA